MKFFRIICLLFVSVSLFAQQKPEDEEKQFRTSIDNRIEYLTGLLDLEDWQVFYMDSILTHDYTAMRDDLKALNEAKSTNQDNYIRVQDKWMEKIYQSLLGVFDEAQTAKYLKNGAAREKKARDKREAKRK